MLLGFGIFGKEEPILLGKFKYRYNPKIGTKIDGKYFGLIKFKLMKTESYDFKESREEEIPELISKAQSELKKEEFFRYLSEVNWN